MKKVLFLFACIHGPSVSAEVHYARGKILDIVAGSDVPGRAVIYIEGFSEAADCPKYGVKNLVVPSLPESDDANFILSAALMAYASEKEVQIQVNDSKRDANGWCEITRFRLNKDF